MIDYKLEESLRPVGPMTSGIGYTETIWKPHAAKQPAAGPHLVKLFREIFKVRQLINVGTVRCWHDTLTRSYPDAYMTFNDVILMGVFYRDGGGGKDLISHFFMRTLKDYSGPLDRWNDDVNYPPAVRKYSVGAILPPGFKMPEKGRRDIHNHAVTQFTWEQIAEIGVDVNTILSFLKLES